MVGSGIGDGTFVGGCVAPDVAHDPNGHQHVIYGSAWNIWWITDRIADTVVPPAPVTSVSATTDVDRVILGWHTPVDAGLLGARIAVRTDRYATSLQDATTVASMVNPPDSNVSATFSGLTYGTTYYYTLFAWGNNNNTSEPVVVSAAPSPMTVMAAKTSPDGAYVALQNLVVTALFSSEVCLYAEDQDRTSGIRVVDPGDGLAIGDVVNVSGIVGTRMLSGYPAERQISSPVITKISGGTPLRPQAMTCGAVGGCEVPPYVPGVKDGIGLNNMGTLVKIAGEVTLVVSSYVYVDDGSGIQDISGRIGVMVKCPSTSIPVNVGNIASTAGVVEGSIPTGWTDNRRYIHIRDWSDLMEHSGIP